MTLENGPEFAVWMMLAGLAACMVWYGTRLEKYRPAGHTVLLTAVLGSLFALVCAKAGYLIHDLGANLLEGTFDEVTALEPELLSFAGGCAGFTAGTALAARLTGIRPMKALDLFAAPACLFLFLARIAEAGMGELGTGSEAELLRFFPIAMEDDWGDPCLSVFVLEALWALVCLIPALRKEPVERDGTVFTRTAVWLLGGQIGWEMLLQYPFVRTFVTSFVSLEQVICAILLLVIVIAGCVRTRKWWTLPVTAALLGASAFFQFYRDNKIGFVLEEGWEWAVDNAVTISRIAFFLISAALIRVAGQAITSKKDET